MTWLRKPVPWGVGALLLALGQTLALGAMLSERISILRSDVVLTLKAEPIDPRDIFRGEYVILRYKISQYTAPKALDFQKGAELWALLKRDGEDWSIDRIVADRPASFEPTDAAAAIRIESLNILLRTDEKIVYRVGFGLERFYVPEGQGRELEKLIGEDRLTIDAAIGPNGGAGIKALRIDGRIVHDEPLF